MLCSHGHFGLGAPAPIAWGSFKWAMIKAYTAQVDIKGLTEGGSGELFFGGDTLSLALQLR